jgi:hypothetical protein
MKEYCQCLRQSFPIALKVAFRTGKCFQGSRLRGLSEEVQLLNHDALRAENE